MRPAIGRIVVAAGLALMAGCAQMRLGAPIASVPNIQKAREAGIAPVALGNFVLAPGKPAGMDSRVVARTNTVYSGFDSSFAKYLRENLAVELAAAGLLEPASRIVIDAQLTDSQLEAATGRGSATVAARFVVKREGATVYDRELRTRAEWNSEFIGVVGIPAAINEYSLLYRKLVSALLDDADFRKAASR
jgi:hypothetical protein